MKTTAPTVTAERMADIRLAVRTACPLPSVAVMLVHGMGSSSRYWGPNLGPLATRYPLVAPDLLGFGHSPKPSESAYTPANHAAALASVAQTAGRPIIVVGHSTGALLALHLAVAYPMLVRGVVLISLPLFTSEREAREQMARSSLLTWLQVRHLRAAAAMCWLMCHARPVVRLLMPALDRAVSPDVARDAVEHTWRSASLTVEHVILQTRPIQLLNQLPPERLLLIHAADDPVAPMGAVADYAEGHPGAHLLRLSDGGHHPYLRRQAETCAAIAAFVEQLSTTAGLPAAHGNDTECEKDNQHDTYQRPDPEKVPHT
ncbi:MAG: alpha/beta fold hydrolase [Dehalococcoidia bacterium]